MLLGGKKRNMLPSDLCLLARPGAARGRGRGHVNARLIQALTTPASQNWPNIHRAGDYHNVQGGKVPVIGDCHGRDWQEKKNMVKRRNVGLRTM